MLFVPFNVPPVTDEDLANIRLTLERGKISGNGSYTTWCEQLINEILGTGKTLLTTSCTHALEMAAALLKLEDGDEVVVPAFTFVSTANAFALWGATPVFADVLDSTLNIDATTVEPLITSKTKAVVVVHYGGVAVDMDPLLELCKSHGISVIEDNAHGIFGSYKGKRLGSLGELGTLSFHETKNISCGEGGALLINNTKFEARAEILREKGTNRKQFLMGAVDKYTWVDLGSSWVISEILAAVLYSQLERRESILGSRTTTYLTYESSLRSWADDNGVRIPSVPSYAESSFHCFHLRFQDLDSRSRFIQHCDERGVNAVFHYQSLNTSPMGRKLGGIPGGCPVSEKASDCLVRLPLFSAMTSEQVEQVINVVTEFKV